MALWQIVILSVFVLSPFLLLALWHPARERLVSRGVPLDRTWVPQVHHAAADDDHH